MVTTERRFWREYRLDVVGPDLDITDLLQDFSEDKSAACLPRTYLVATSGGWMAVGASDILGGITRTLWNTRRGAS